MKRYIVISIYVSGEHYIESEKDGGYDDMLDAIKCLHQNGSTMIIDCENGTIHENDSPIVTRMLHQEYPEVYPPYIMDEAWNNGTP